MRRLRVKLRRRPQALLAGLAVLLVLALTVGRPATHLAAVVWHDRDTRRPPPAGQFDDASRLNATAVEVIDAASDAAEAERQIAALVARAAHEGRQVSVAGARHTMGGHTLYPGGLSLNMRPLRGMTLDEAHELLRVGAGATWAEVLPYLDARGRSVAVMQSNDSFTVGGSLSANCHGWVFAQPPIASSVESFRLLRADGSAARCSRSENAELFSLALGGYGLFGVILDAELRVVPNAAYHGRRWVVSADQLVTTLRREGEGPPRAGMAFGRLCVAPSRFLTEGIVNVFTPAAAPPAWPPLEEPKHAAMTRAVFRGSEGSDYGKELRWDLEKRHDETPGESVVSRNSLFFKGVGTLENRSDDTTDILHEYFVPPERFDDFVERTRVIVRARGADLLNVTVRDVRRDDDAFLRYADRDLLALVMLFVQPRTAEGEAEMQALTRDLIDAALGVGGRYYLPYRLHATDEQFHRAYPRAAEFFALKRRYDPGEVFQNQFYTRYAASTR